MNYPRHLTLLAVAGLLGLAQAANAYESTPPREQRMGEALQTYRDGTAKNPQPGPVARTEEDIKRGARNAGAAVKHGAQRTGEAVKHGAQRAGQAVGTGVEKTGDAIRRGGDKLKEKSGG